MKSRSQLSMLGHAFNLSTWEADGSLRVQRKKRQDTEELKLQQTFHILYTMMLSAVPMHTLVTVPTYQGLLSCLDERSLRNTGGQKMRGEIKSNNNAQKYFKSSSYCKLSKQTRLLYIARGSDAKMKIIFPSYNIQIDTVSHRLDIVLCVHYVFYWI